MQEKSRTKTQEENEKKLHGLKRKRCNDNKVQKIKMLQVKVGELTYQNQQLKWKLGQGTTRPVSGTINPTVTVTPTPISTGFDLAFETNKSQLTDRLRLFADHFKQFFVKFANQNIHSFPYRIFAFRETRNFLFTLQA